MIDPNTLDLIDRFNEKHGLETENQIHMLGAEIGEVSDAWLKQSGLGEELADVCFVAHSIALLEGVEIKPNAKVYSSIDSSELVHRLHEKVAIAWRAHNQGAETELWLDDIVGMCEIVAVNEGIDLHSKLNNTAAENLGKSPSKSGNKVTKE